MFTLYIVGSFDYSLNVLAANYRGSSKLQILVAGSKCPGRGKHSTPSYRIEFMSVSPTSLYYCI